MMGILFYLKEKIVLLVKVKRWKKTWVKDGAEKSVELAQLLLVHISLQI